MIMCAFEQQALTVELEGSIVHPFGAANAEAFGHRLLTVFGFDCNCDAIQRWL